MGMRLTDEQVMQDNKRFANCNVLAELKYCGWDIPHRKSITNDEIHFYAWLCRSAVSMLKEQEAAKQKWISVKERYPEKEGFYLVSADHGNYHPWIAEMRIFKGIKGFCSGAVMPCVGAWMPLPEPYKEGLVKGNG